MRCRWIDGIRYSISIDTGALDEFEGYLLSRLQGFAFALQQNVNPDPRAFLFLVVVATSVVATTVGAGHDVRWMVFFSYMDGMWFLNGWLAL